jgi:cytochrome c-type biogenesis protein CcmH
MAPEERQQMIRTMVGGLAQRLEQNPNDPAGWERLANAYRVLGETEKAEKAAARAKEVQGGAAAPPPAANAAAPKAPSPADIEAAQRMSTEDRQKMIRGMVESLAQRMQQNPSDAAGWTRLGRAYRVLGERAKAEEALVKAAELQPQNADAQLDLALAVLENDGGDKPGSILSDRFVQQVRKVALLQPENPEVLWYLGLAAAQRKRPDDAKAYWSKLLAQLQPGTGDYDTVNQAMQALR